MAKARVVIAIIGGTVYFKIASQMGSDFKTCNKQALDIVLNLDEGAFLRQYPPQEQHDQIDEYLHICMLGKGYAYHPSAWERCPTEKIPICYGPTLESEIRALFYSDKRSP